MHPSAERSSHYRKQPHLLTAAERNFYATLMQATNGEWLVMAKVRLADLLDVVGVDHRDPRWLSYFNPIAQKHADFVLCNPGTISPQLVIELDDSSHQRVDRQDRDDFVDETLTSAGLPILHVRVQYSYSAERLASDIRLGMQSPVVSNHQGLDSSAAQPPAPTRRAPRTRRISYSRGRRNALSALVPGLLAVLLLVVAFQVLVSSWPPKFNFTLPTHATSIPGAGAPPTAPPPTRSSPSGASAPATPPSLASQRSVPATVASPNLNLRTGPGTDYPAITVLKQGTHVQVIGKDPTATWLKVMGPEGQTGWLSARFVTLGTSLDAIPLVSAP